MFFKGFNKIAKDKKKKLKFSPDMSNEQAAKYVKKKADHIMETGFAEGSPKQFDWKYEPKHSLAFAKEIKSNWPEWFKQETEEWKYNHGPEERKDHFDKWSKEPELKPIILVHGTDGKIHIWDGHHRVAKALTLGMKNVPALVGTKKKGVKNDDVRE